MLLLKSEDVESNPGAVEEDSFDSSNNSITGSDYEPLSETFDQHFSSHYDVQSTS